ncbi:MAG: hypothetical protein IJ074_07085, partial [Clostridia bacterium]|nr:hypothetical protein [Clostridia bacterium]
RCPQQDAPEANQVEMDARLYLMNCLLNGDDMRAAIAKAKDAGYSRNDVYKAKLELIQRIEDMEL